MTSRVRWHSWGRTRAGSRSKWEESLGANPSHSRSRRAAEVFQAKDDSQTQTIPLWCTFQWTGSRSPAASWLRKRSWESMKWGSAYCRRSWRRSWDWRASRTWGKMRGLFYSWKICNDWFRQAIECGTGCLSNYRRKGRCQRMPCPSGMSRRGSRPSRHRSSTSRWRRTPLVRWSLSAASCGPSQCSYTGLGIFSSTLRFCLFYFEKWPTATKRSRCKSNAQRGQSDRIRKLRVARLKNRKISCVRLSKSSTLGQGLGTKTMVSSTIYLNRRYDTSSYAWHMMKISMTNLLDS